MFETIAIPRGHAVALRDLLTELLSADPQAKGLLLTDRVEIDAGQAHEVLAALHDAIGSNSHARMLAALADERARAAANAAADRCLLRGTRRD